MFDETKVVGLEQLLIIQNTTKVVYFHCELKYTTFIHKQNSIFVKYVIQLH